MLEWDDLRHVLAVQQEGSLSRAAQRLGVTRTTVGRRLQGLEARLGVRLFDRTPEGLLATEAGLDLAESARRMEAEALAAEGRLLGRDAALQGPLRVSTAGFIYEVYAGLFGTFIQRHPGVELIVTLDDAYVSLARREADVVLRLGSQPGEHLLGRRVARLQFALYAAPALVARIGAGAALAAWPWVSWGLPGEAPWLEAWLAAQAPGARIVLRVTTFAAGFRSVREGIGVHFLPIPLAEEAGLVPLGVTLTEEARDLWALTLPELRANRRVRAFLDHAYATFQVT